MLLPGAYAFVGEIAIIFIKKERKIHCFYMDKLYNIVNVR